MRKVSIIGPRVGNIPQSIADAFRRIGWEAMLYEYSPPSRQNLVRVAYDRIHDPFYRKATAHAFNSLLRDHIVSQLRMKQIDLLLILKGDCIEADNRDALFRAKVPIITWAIDSLSRAEYTKSYEEISKHVFYIDAGDISDNTTNNSWLPLGFDDLIYKPNEEKLKDIDILLIGKLGYRYKRREMYLRMLNEATSKISKNSYFIGSTGTLFGNASLYLSLGHRKGAGVKWLSRRIPAHQLASVIGRSKICINIHQDDGAMPVNPMFFAIPATATCQLAEAKPYLHKWLVPWMDYAECFDNNFLDVLSDLLVNNEKRQALACQGHESSRSHTFVRRLTNILEIL
ncbi:MAG: hypothetical protein HPY67_09115 [Syntrophaceae bacterium]|nr:hypothetical protein [Syntrophaceae bacterium]